MMYRSIVFVHGVLALVGGLAVALGPGWFLYGWHFGPIYELDPVMFTQVKSLVFLMGVGYLTAGALLIAVLWVRDRRVRLGVGMALVVGDFFGTFHALIGLNNFGGADNQYSVVFLLLYLLLLLASFLLLFTETVAWASPASVEERPA